MDSHNLEERICLSFDRLTIQNTKEEGMYFLGFLSKFPESGIPLLSRKIFPIRFCITRCYTHHKNFSKCSERVQIDRNESRGLLWRVNEVMKFWKATPIPQKLTGCMDINHDTTRTDCRKFFAPKIGYENLIIKFLYLIADRFINVVGKEQNGKDSITTVMSTEERERIRNFSANLRDVGKLCEFEKLERAENPVVAGKIVRISPFKSNRSIKGPCTTVITLRDVFLSIEGTRREFKVFFFNEAAKVMAQSKLRIKDFLAISDPKLFRNSIFSRSPKHTFNVTLIVGTKKGNRIQDIFGKGRLMTDWYSLSITSRRRSSKQKLPIASGENKILANEQNFDKEKNMDEIPASSNSFPNSRASTSTGGRTHLRFRASNSMTEQIRQEKRKLNRVYSDHSDDEEKLSKNMPASLAEIDTEKEDEELTIVQQSPSVSRVPVSVTVNNNRDFVVECSKDNYEEPAEVNIAPHSSLNGLESTGGNTSLLGTKKVRLKDVRINMNITTFGVITSTGKDPKLTVNGAYNTKILIADETKEEFLIDIYANANEIMPTLRRYDVIKISNMKITASKNKLHGSIRHASNIVTFSREDPLVIFQQSQSYECSSEDRKRVEELIHWMQENVPDARIFTSICDIKSTTASANLLGNLVEKKLFGNSSIIVLRICDGTGTREYFHYYDLMKNTLVVDQEKTSSKNLNFVDINIVDADETFHRKIEKLQIDTSVGLYNVRVKPKPYRCGTHLRHAIKLYFKAVHENMKFFHQNRNQNEFEAINIDDIDQHPPTAEPCLAVSRMTKKSKKRKLYNSEASVTLQDNETNAVVQPVSETVEQNCEIVSLVLKPCCIRVPRLDTTIPGRQIDYSSEQEDEPPLAVELPASCNQNRLYSLSMEILKSGTNCSSNSANHNKEFKCLKEWPDVLETDFWIQVSWVSMIPRISRNSSEIDVLGLVRARCKHCKNCIPFFFATEWVENENGIFSLCSSCKTRGEEVILQHMLVADLLLQDCNGKKARAIIYGSESEKLFGYTLSELINSEAARARVRNFVDAHQDLTLNLKLLEERRQEYLFKVLDSYAA